MIAEVRLSPGESVVGVLDSVALDLNPVSIAALKREPVEEIK
jgi:hypothetical protein